MSAMFCSPKHKSQCSLPSAVYDAVALYGLFLFLSRLLLCDFTFYNLKKDKQGLVMKKRNTSGILHDRGCQV